jgi:hypothetical protein
MVSTSDWSESSKSTSLTRREKDKHNKENNESSPISLNETRNVHRIKIVAVLVLVGSALAVALVIYFYLRNSEVNAFKDSFSFDSQKVLRAVGFRIESNLGAMDSFANNAVSFAEATNQSWPFVTLPDYALKVSKMRGLSDCLTFTLSPVVTREQRHKWEAYAVDSNSWVNESKKLQENDEFWYGIVPYDEPAPTTITNLTGTMPYETE